METQTIKKIAGITDPGLFERVATAVLRLDPEYKNLVHTGINADGKTRKSPVDGLCFIGEGGKRLVLAHHTIVAAPSLERKWLLDPATVKRRKNSKSAPPEPGDVIKTLEILRNERIENPDLSATLILATNQEPDEDLLRKVVAIGRKECLTIDFWTLSRIGGLLDTDARGQVIRRKLLGIDEELLSRELFARLSNESALNFDAGDNTEVRVFRQIDAQLSFGLDAITFLVGPSGSGKTIAAHKALEAHIKKGGCALVVTDSTIERTTTLEQAVSDTLQRLHPTLAQNQNPLALFTEEEPLLILIEDVSRSTQPQRLIEKIAGWAPKSNNSNRPPWRIICPVWPHLLGGVQSQVRSRIEDLTLRPEPMSHAECTDAVVRKASQEFVDMSRVNAETIATALGDDPLLIALNNDWKDPSVNSVFEVFVDDVLSRVSQKHGHVKSELRSALYDLGEKILLKRNFAPLWDEILGWELGTATSNCLRSIAQEADIFRIVETNGDSMLLFRHDRVRNWLLAEAAFKLECEKKLSNDLLEEPLLAEIVGQTLVRSDVSNKLADRVRVHGPLALFHALRLLPFGDPRALTIAEVASEWLRDRENLGPSKRTLRCQAMATIERVSGEFMSELLSLFPEQSPMAMIAMLRNGNVRGGIALTSRFSIETVAAWTAEMLAVAKQQWGDKFANDLTALLASSDKIPDTEIDAIIAFFGILGDPSTAPALQRYWDHDERREDRLALYLWALSRCATPSTAAQLLEPVCSFWGALPSEKDGSKPSPRDDLAAYSVRFAFERMPPIGALGYLIERAEGPDLAWQIEYMLHNVDHSSAVVFQAERGARRLRSGGNSYTFNHHAREHWRRTSEGYGTPMSSSTRAVLLELWQDKTEDADLRTAAFDIWTASIGENDLIPLASSADDAVLSSRVLRERLRRGDTAAVPALVERLDGEDGLHWWFYARYVWTARMHEALDRALEREASKPLPDENGMYEIGSTLTRVVMRLTQADAEHLLLRYWDKFGHSMHFVQAALFVATPRLLIRADTTIRSDPNPTKLFTHFTMQFGIQTTDEVGISRESQLVALASYIDFLRPEDVDQLAEVCNENGWYDLRRRLFDHHRKTEQVETPQRFLCTLDETLRRGHIGFIDHEIDRLQKADVSWAKIAETLRQWLSEQTEVRALELAAQAVRHAGKRGDSCILNCWQGSETAMKAETIEDIEFALRLNDR